MLAKIYIYIVISLLFLSTLILPIGNYYNDSNRRLSEDKITESIDYVRTKSKNELSDYVILADSDYVFISKTSTEDEFDSVDTDYEKYIIENVVDQFKLEKRYYNRKLYKDQKGYRGYRVIAEFSNGVQIYPQLEEDD